MNWLYTQKIDIQQPELVPNNTSYPECLTSLIELWVLSDFLLISALQNAATQQIILLIEKENAVSSSCFENLYARTTANSPLRRLFVNLCAHRFEDKTFGKTKDKFPRDMLVDMISVVLKRNTMTHEEFSETFKTPAINFEDYKVLEKE